jgi:hypothetical protein
MTPTSTRALTPSILVTGAPREPTAPARRTYRPDRRAPARSAACRRGRALRRGRPGSRLATSARGHVRKTPRPVPPLPGRAQVAAAPGRLARVVPAPRQRRERKFSFQTDRGLPLANALLPRVARAATGPPGRVARGGQTPATDKDPTPATGPNQASAPSLASRPRPASDPTPATGPAPRLGTDLTPGPASAVLGSGSTGTGRPARTSTGLTSTGLTSTWLTSMGPASTGPSSSTGLARTDPGSSTGGAGTGQSRAGQTSTGRGSPDRLAQDRPGPVRSHRRSRGPARTARRTPTTRPGSLTPIRARVPTSPAGTHTARAPGAQDRRRNLASRAPTTARDRQAGRRRDQWDQARAADQGTRAVAGASTARAAQANTDPDSQDRGRTALGTPARRGRVRARDRAGRARAGLAQDSTSHSTSPPPLGAPGIPGIPGALAMHRSPAPRLAPRTPGHGTGPAAT